MIAYAPLLAVLVALLVGLAVGKAWERYKLRDGRWIDRRRLRETPHYMLGLNFLVDNQVDQAIDELTQATSTDTDALEIQMILGNLYRQKGQVGRAINVHQALLQRTDLRTLEHAYVLLCLGLDFRHGGFVDRALEAFQEVVRLDPRNRYAFVNLQKLYEDQHQWAEAARVREQIAAIDARRREEDQQILGFLRNEMGSRPGHVRRRRPAPRRRSRTPSTSTPNRAGLSQPRRRARAPGQPRRRRRGVGDARAGRPRPRVSRVRTARARLPRARPRRGGSSNCASGSSPATRRTGARVWRCRATSPLGGHHRQAFDLLLDALPHNPHGLVIHQEIWQALSALGLDPGLVRRYVELTRDAVFYLDPHVCVRCRYRSTELLWQCPQCHEWNTFVEERIAPAKDTIVAELSEG